MIPYVRDDYQSVPHVGGGDPRNCWATARSGINTITGQEYETECSSPAESDTLGLCPKHREELVPVRLEPCPEFRIPLEGDLLTCATCGHWSEDHGR